MSTRLFLNKCQFDVRLFRIIVAIIISVFATAWQNVGAAHFDIVFTILVFAIVLICQQVGLLLFTSIPLSMERPWLDFLSIPLGLTITGAVLQFLFFYVYSNALIVFIFFTAAATLISIISQTPTKFIKNKDGIWALFALIIILIAVSFWSQQSLKQIEQQPSQVILRPWHDQLIHASHITMIANGDISDGRYECIGEPVSLYHYGSYMLPAVLHVLSTVSSISLSTAFWHPLGASMFYLGVLAVAVTMWGFLKGSIFLSWILLFPSALLPKSVNAYMDIHWLLEVSPGLYYGLCLAISAFACVSFAPRKDIRLALFYALGFSFLLIFIKAQLIIIVVSTILIYGIMKYPIRMSQRVAALICITILAPIIIFTLSHLISGSPQFSGEPAKLNYFITSIRFSNITLYNAIHSLTGSLSAIMPICAILLFSFLMFGPLLLSYIIFFCAYVIKGTSDHTGFLPLIILIFYLGYCALLPVNHFGNPFEMQHRPFVFVFFIFSFFVFKALYANIDRLNNIRTDGTRAMAISISVLFIFLPFPYFLGKTIQDHPQMHFANRSFPLGIMMVSTELRNLHSKGDVFLDTSLDPDNFIIAISETRSFLSRFSRLSVQNREKRRTIYEEHHRISDSIILATDQTVAFQIASENNINWIIVRPESDLAWSPNKEHIAFEYLGHLLLKVS